MNIQAERGSLAQRLTKIQNERDRLATRVDTLDLTVLTRARFLDEIELLEARAAGLRARLAKLDASEDGDMN